MVAERGRCGPSEGPKDVDVQTQRREEGSLILDCGPAGLSTLEGPRIKV